MIIDTSGENTPQIQVPELPGPTLGFAASCFRPRRSALGLLVLALLLVATHSVPVGASSPEPCALLTLPDVQKVLGAGFKRFPSPAKVCVYIRMGAHASEVILDLSTGNAASLLRKGEDAYKNLPGQQVDRVSNLGEGAFYAVGEDNKGGVIFGKGNLVATLSVYHDLKPDREAALKLAKIVYARL